MQKKIILIILIVLMFISTLNVFATRKDVYKYSTNEVQNLTSAGDSTDKYDNSMGFVTLGYDSITDKFYYIKTDSTGTLKTEITNADINVSTDDTLLVDLYNISTTDTLKTEITNSSITIVLPSYSEFVGDTLYAIASEDSVIFSTQLRQFSFYTDTNIENIWFKLNDQVNWTLLTAGKTFSIANISLNEFKYKRYGSANVLIIYEGVR